MTDKLKLMNLKFNPFEPAASGAPVQEEIWLPQRWKDDLNRMLTLHKQGRGVKAIAISGEYGSGKSYILQWLKLHAFPSLRVKPFYFDNPGVQFYDLANSLLRQIGRKDFSKAVWELSGLHVGSYQRTLFSSGYEDYLEGISRSRQRQDAVLNALQSAIRKAGIVKDEEIAHRIARIVAETPKKPYFEYRDFLSGRQNALVAEGEEAPYFSAILKTLRLGAGIKSVGFLIDEFEEVSLQKRLSRRESYDYLATLKRLINLTQEDDLWLVVALTPDAVDKTKQLEPALWERFTGQGEYLFKIPPLTKDEAKELIQKRLSQGRLNQKDDVFPFPPEVVDILQRSTYSNPRHLVKTCFFALSEGRDEQLPFSRPFIQKVENKLYPAPAKA